MNLLELSREYFAKFSRKDLTGLTDMFADDVVLVDWQINQSGKKNVVKANKNIFNSVNKILAEPILMSQNENTVFAEILVRADDTAVLYVVDVITFDEVGKIKKITAYKR